MEGEAIIVEKNLHVKDEKKGDVASPQEAVDKSPIWNQWFPTVLHCRVDEVGSCL